MGVLEPFILIQFLATKLKKIMQRYLTATSLQRLFLLPIVIVPLLKGFS